MDPDQGDEVKVTVIATGFDKRHRELRVIETEEPREEITGSGRPMHAESMPALDTETKQPETEAAPEVATPAQFTRMETGPT